MMPTSNERERKQMRGRMSGPLNQPTLLASALQGKLLGVVPIRASALPFRATRHDPLQITALPNMRRIRYRLAKSGS
jgi:hypothetical protein